MNYNGEVEHHGDSYYFTDDRARTVSDVISNSNISVSFAARKGQSGKVCPQQDYPATSVANFCTAVLKKLRERA